MICWSGSKGKSDSVRLSAYYTDSQDWRFRTATGPKSTWTRWLVRWNRIQEVSTALRNNYKQSLQADFAAMQVADGYTRGSGWKVSLYEAVDVA